MFKQNGYVGQSMSIRAKDAYDNGLLSKAKIKKYDLEAVGIDLPIGFVKSLMPHIIKPAEWHHTGKYFNETDFYDLEEVKRRLEHINIEQLFKIYKEEQSEQERLKAEKGYYAYIKYGEWEGTRKHPKLVEYEDYAFIKGKWAHISRSQKKKIDGKHFKVIKTYKIKPKGMSAAVRNAIFKKLNL